VWSLLGRERMGEEEREEQYNKGHTKTHSFKCYTPSKHCCGFGQSLSGLRAGFSNRPDPVLYKFGTIFHTKFYLNPKMVF
jgi:hypothetical protein